MECGRSPELLLSHPCPQCNSPIKDSSSATVCSLCSCFIHNLCTGLPSKVTDILRAENQFGIVYFCVNCLPIANSLIIRNKLTADITKRYDMLQLTLTAFSSSVQSRFIKLEQSILNLAQQLPTNHRNQSPPLPKSCPGTSDDVISTKSTSDGNRLNHANLYAFQISNESPANKIIQPPPTERTQPLGNSTSTGICTSLPPLTNGVVSAISRQDSKLLPEKSSVCFSSSVVPDVSSCSTVSDDTDSSEEYQEYLNHTKYKQQKKIKKQKIRIPSEKNITFRRSNTNKSTYAEVTKEGPPAQQLSSKQTQIHPKLNNVIRGTYPRNVPDVNQNNSRPAPVIGTKKNTGITAVKPKQTEIHCVFVTRFAPETTVADVTKIVFESTGLKLNCRQLKVKYPDRYSSFCLSSTTVQQYQLLLDPSIWPDGILAMPFLGKRSQTSSNQQLSFTSSQQWSQQPPQQQQQQEQQQQPPPQQQQQQQPPPQQQQQPPPQQQQQQPPPPQQHVQQQHQQRKKHRKQLHERYQQELQQKECQHPNPHKQQEQQQCHQEPLQQQQQCHQEPLQQQQQSTSQLTIQSLPDHQNSELVEQCQQVQQTEQTTGEHTSHTSTANSASAHNDISSRDPAATNSEWGNYDASVDTSDSHGSNCTSSSHPPLQLENTDEEDIAGN